MNNVYYEYPFKHVFKKKFQNNLIEMVNMNYS